MARQRGAVKYIGTLGDIRHFKIKGLKGFYAGLVGGPTKEQVLNGEEFQRTRENMNEFGGSAKAGKAIRIAFAPLMKHMADTRFTGRLTGIMKKINKEDQSEARGQRAVLISQVPHLLEGLKFNKNVSFDSVFRAPFSLAAVVERNATTLTVPAFNAVNYLSIPKGATHFRVINAIGSISDFHYNVDEGEYEAKEPALNELVDIQYSDYTAISTDVAELTITSTLADSPVMTEDVSLLNALGVEFLQKVGANYYMLAAGNALKIHKVF